VTVSIENELRTEIASLHERVAELTRALEASKLREQALRESETRLQLIVDGSDDGGWDWNIPTGESYMSPGWFRILGYEPGELPSNAETWNRVIHPEDVKGVWQTLQGFFDGRTPTYEVEHRMVHKSGKAVRIMARGKVFERDAEGRPIRMTGTIRDISGRKETEELRRSQALLNTLIELSPAVIHIRDLAGRFLLANRKVEALFGLSREQVVGKVDQEILEPETIRALRQNDQTVIEGGQPVWIEETLHQGGEPRTYLSIKFPLHDEHGKCFAIGGISTDITERKRAEEERTALQERLIEAQRAALRELSTPLIPIAEGLLVMPLIGTVDSQRAQQLMDALLAGVAAQRAHTVIIDVTGVEVVDTAVANALVQASQAVRLLGAEVVLTGIRPEVAQTFVGMGADLSSILIHGSLRSGIASALRREGAAWERPREGISHFSNPLSPQDRGAPRR
jgi:rsbT co-antagonist protein RsbR